MRGKSDTQTLMLCSLTPDQLVPQNHPIRHIRPIVDQALKEMSPIFSKMYADVGRPSIPPEHLLKACLLIALYSIRSEREFCERLQYDLLFKWFLDLNIIDPAFDASSFSKNKERLLEHQVAHQFFAAVLDRARRQCCPSESIFGTASPLMLSPFTIADNISIRNSCGIKLLPFFLIISASLLTKTYKKSPSFAAFLMWSKWP